MARTRAVTEAAAFEANFAELLAWYAAYGGEALRAPDHWRSHSGVPFRALNAVTSIRLATRRGNGHLADERIAEVNAWFDERGLPWRWLVHDSSRPRSLGGRLVAAGLARLGDHPAMGRALDGFEPEALPTGVTVERVTDEASLERWRVVSRLGMELDPARDEAWWTAHRRPGFADDAPLVNVVATLEGTPVAVAALFDAAGVAGIYNVATVPEARGRGLGRAVTAVAMAEGRRRGLRWAALGASPLGLPVYRRLGFVEFGRIRSFGRPG